MKTVKEVIEHSGVKFGTSGARALVSDFTEEVCTAFTFSFLDTVKKVFEFERVAVGMDNRPSSPAIASVVCGAAKTFGVKVDFYGVLPTPGLALHSMVEKIPSIMITGSHIPFDRNGIKFYRPDGEITKEDEVSILNSTIPISLVNILLPEVNKSAVKNYLNRYRTYFGKRALDGLKIGIYEHSSAGRDLYYELLTFLGAEVISLGRSDKFVPIDTEAVSDVDKQRAKLWSKEHQFDAIFSTDGDGDRPLIADENGDWLRGDIVGLLTASILCIEALAVPVSCNTAIEKSGLFKEIIRTRIGSPYVIEAFDDLRLSYSSFAGFEANGGFLLGSNLEYQGHTLYALPTRDALLPVIVLLSEIVKKKVPLSKLVQDLPQRFTSSDRIQEIPVEKSKKFIEQVLDDPKILLEKCGLEEFKIVNINQIDGLRFTLDNGIILHLRPSGNAPELRFYVETDKQQYADELAKKVHTLLI